MNGETRPLRDEVTFLTINGKCEVIHTPARVAELRRKERDRLVQRHHAEHGEYPDMDGQIAAIQEAEEWAYRVFAREEAEREVREAEQREVTRRRIMMRQSVRATLPTPTTETL